MAPLTEAAADRFAMLRGQKIRIGSQDLKIAAIALAENALLLSAHLRDFQKVPGCAWRIGCGNDPVERVLCPEQRCPGS